MLKQSMYEQALTAIKKDPRARYNERLKEIMARQEKSPSPKKATGTQRGESLSTKRDKTIKPEELEKRKKAAEEILESEFAAQLPPPPSIGDNVAVATFKAPLTLIYTFLWALGGGMSDPGYKTRKALGWSEAEWVLLESEEQEELVAKELWVSANLAEYEAETAETERSGPKTGKEKRLERQRKKAKRDPSAPMIED